LSAAIVNAMNEFDVIKKYFDRSPVKNAELGIGDDAALVSGSEHSLAVCTDMLVQGRHFFDDADPASVGYKSLAVNLSDLAAMGATPHAFTLALALPEIEQAWLDQFSAGLFKAADQYQCELIGGDTTKGPLAISVTALGRVLPGTALRRDRAEPGDDVWVSGALGAAAGAVHARNHNEMVPEQALNRLDWPIPRVELGQALLHLASAAIDVSDGLVADLGHLAQRSRVAITVVAPQVPVDSVLASMTLEDPVMFALNGGDDYELAFCAAPENQSAIDAIARRLDLPLTRVGCVHAGQGVHVTDRSGQSITNIRSGYDHFA
jgi:thiamine-monophosphate kinase